MPRRAARRTGRRPSVRCHWASRLVKALLSMWEWNSSGPMTCLQLVAPPSAVGVDAVDPEPAGLEQHLGAELAQEGGVAGGLDVAEDPVGDVGGDVDLLLARPEPVGAVDGELRALLAPGVGRLPGVAGAAGAVLAGVRPRPVEGVVAVAQQRLRGVGLGEDEEREHEDLGVPEHVPAVALAGQRLGADVDRRVVGVRGDQQVVEAEPQRAGEPLVADDLAVAGLPQARPDRAAGGDDRVEPVRRGARRARRGSGRAAGRPRRGRGRCRSRRACPCAASRPARRGGRCAR